MTILTAQQLRQHTDRSLTLPGFQKTLLMNNLQEVHVYRGKIILGPIGSFVLV